MILDHVILVGDSRYLPIADKSVHCCVTSPPYWGLRDYGVEGQLGMESTPDEYVANLVGVLTEVHRVLRDDATLWLNLGDSYANDSKWGGSGGNSSSKNYTSGLGGCVGQKAKRNTKLKPKSLVGIPWRVAFALRDSGWTLRQDIIWHKPNAMPESVRDRPSKGHEYLFLLTKSHRYFYDKEAVKEKAVSSHKAGNKRHKYVEEYLKGESQHHRTKSGLLKLTGVEWDTRNLRSVWKIPIQGFRGTHFATFPVKLATRCILAGTSAKGCCPECGSPWVRILERSRVPTRPAMESKVVGLGSDVVGNRDPLRHVTATKSVGWKPSCKCGVEDTSFCIVLDPFAGAGSAGVAAVGSGRCFVGVELNPEYAAMADRRISRPHAPAIRQREEMTSLPMFAGME